MMKISVVIPTKNEEKNIENCLKSLKKQTYKNFDIFIIDSFSTDKTVEIAKKYTQNIIIKKTRFPGEARNLGVKNSDADIIAFIDADTLAPEEWLERIAEDFSNNSEVVAVGGVLKPLEPRLIDRVMFKINSDWWYRFSAFFGFYQLGTPNCAYRREIFLKAHGFNEEMSMLEDTELSLRIKEFGKVFIDKKLYTFNSTRRFKQEGYFMVFMRYLGAYAKMFLFGGSKVKAKHFETIKHE